MRTPPGFVPLAPLARRLGMNPATVRAWVRKGLVPARRIGPRVIHVNPAAVEALAALWRCPACPYEAPGPDALAVHVDALHGARKGAGAPGGLGGRAKRSARVLARSRGFRCPAPDCPRRGRAFKTPAELAAHLEAHAEDRRRTGAGERRRAGRPPRTAPPVRCSAPGCRVTVDTRRGGGRGLCAKHYQESRRRRAGR